MSRISILAAALAGFSLTSVASASPRGLHQYQSLALAGSGERLAAVESVETADETNLPHGRIVVRDEGGRVLSRVDPCVGCQYAGLIFSPNGDALAFVASNPKTATAALDVWRNGTLKTVAVVHGLAQTPRWSPGGDVIAVLVTLGAHKQLGPSQAGTPLTGEIGTVQDEQRIAVVSASGGSLRLVSPADTWVYEYDWTPDRRGFVATVAKGDGDDNWWVAKLAAVDLASGSLRVIAAPSYQMNAPHVSADGRTVALIGGLMSDFGQVGGDLYTVPMSGGTPLDITPAFKGSFSGLAWRAGGLIATAQHGADTQVDAVDPVTGAVRTLFSGALSITAGDGRVALSDNGLIGAWVGQTFVTPPQVQIGPFDAMRAVTHDNDRLEAAFEAQSVTWSSDGFTVQGWLLAPQHPAPRRTYPMVTVIHGGPSAASEPEYLAFGHMRDLIDRGYFVFEPNPRGSFGQGEAFTRANVRDLGGGDLRDILAGVDAVEKIAPVDDRRLGVFGHSYGGFMTMWAVTHTDRFHAAVAGAGLSNWVSYYGENGIDKWMIPFFGASAYDDPGIYDKLSPIRYIKNAKTPTFMYVGERDVECPAPQSIEFWHGLQAMGAPVSLVIYPGEGHGIRQPAHKHDLDRRLIGWFDQYLAPSTVQSGAHARRPGATANGTAHQDIELDHAS